MSQVYPNRGPQGSDRNGQRRNGEAVRNGGGWGGGKARSEERGEAERVGDPATPNGESLGRTRHAALGHQHVEGDEKVEVDPAQIHADTLSMSSISGIINDCLNARPSALSVLPVTCTAAGKERRSGPSWKETL